MRRTVHFKVVALLDKAMPVPAHVEIVDGRLLRVRPSRRQVVWEWPLDRVATLVCHSCIKAEVATKKRKPRITRGIKLGGAR